VAFLRFSRDKRGVENFYLVHQTTNRRGKVRPRVLYWYRSPPDIKVGREPFDAELRLALEKQNPDITFDWRAIVETPIPSADADKWRERRRAERAAKHAAAAEEAAEVANTEPEAEAEIEAEASDAPAAAETVVTASEAAEVDEGEIAALPASPTSAPAGDAMRKRRRRRRGGRGGNGPRPGAAPGGAEAGATSVPAAPRTDPAGD
jgi:hypothetical protein